MVKSVIGSIESLMFASLMLVVAIKCDWVGVGVTFLLTTVASIGRKKLKLKFVEIKFLLFFQF
jgi:hypothetical protein